MVYRLLFALFLFYSPSLFANCSPGGDGSPPCLTAKAEFIRAVGCPSGTFDGLNGECYKCPTHYAHQVARTYNDPKVCKRTYSREYHSAISIKCSDKAGDSKKGYNVWGLTDCYRCPKGYSHDSSKLSSDSHVCWKQESTQYAPASAHNKFYCDSGQTQDPRNGGECWQCPPHSGRNANPVTSDSACTFDAAHVCASGMTRYGNRCGKTCYSAHNCGGDGQKACDVTQCLPSCSKGHYEDFNSGSVCKATPANSTPFAMGMDTMGDALDGMTSMCEQGGEDILAKMQGTDGASPDKGPFANKNIFALVECPDQFDIGYFCAAPSYVGAYFHGIAAITNGGQGVLQAVQNFDSKPPCSKMVPPINGLCAGIKATGEYVASPFQCISDVYQLVVDEYTDPQVFTKSGKSSTGDHSAEIEAICKLSGNLAFGYSADLALAAATEGALAEEEAVMAVQQTIKAAMALHSILKKANTARKVVNTAKQVAADTDDEKKARIKQYIKTTAACAPMMNSGLL